MYNHQTWALSILTLAMATAANAASPKLIGDFAFTGSAACLNSLSGFNPNFTPTTDQAFQHSYSVEGIRHFNGDGTGTVRGTEVGIVPPSGGLVGVNAHSSIFSFNFTYTLNADRSFTTDVVPGSFSGQYVTGPAVGQTYTVDNFTTMVGLLSNDNKTFTLATTTTTVETITFIFNGVPTSSHDRVCHRSRVGIAM
jgi:hypothetical protein